MDEREWLAERFEEHRTRLRAVAEPIISRELAVTIEITATASR